MSLKAVICAEYTPRASMPAEAGSLTGITASPQTEYILRSRNHQVRFRNSVSLPFCVIAEAFIRPVV